MQRFQKTVRFLLAALLWLHACFLINFQPDTLSKLSGWLHLSAVEFILFVLLLVFSFVAGSGFWAGVGNLLYVYFFPFVVFFYISVLLFYALRSLGFFGTRSAKPVVPNPEMANTTVPTQNEATSPARNRLKVSAQRLMRPFTKFTILWCLFLLTATHVTILAAALAVVLWHLVRDIVFILRIAWISGGQFREVEQKLHGTVDDLLTKVRAVTKESPPDPALKNIWSTLQGYERVFRTIQDDNLVSKWALLIGAVIFGSMYVYVAFLFSFAYYGIARLTIVNTFSWAEYLVIALFIPFYATDLPKNIPIRVLGGLHCLLVLSLGIGGVAQYLRRRVKSITTMAAVISVKLSDQEVRQKRLILEEKFPAKPAAPNPSQNSPQ